MDVDFWGVVNGTKAFLPHLIESGDGHVVNVSSLFGIFSVPGQAAYNSAKFAVRGFTEALRQEMAVAKHPVKVTTVHPGGIKTAIARNADRRRGHRRRRRWPTFFDKKLAKTTPEKAAKIILEAVRKNKARVLVGADAKALDVIVRITGSGYQQLFSTVTSKADAAACTDAAAASVAERVGVQPGAGHRARVGAPGDLAQHVGQCAGVELAGDLVERQHLRLAQLVAPVQRHHVLRADQRRRSRQHDGVVGHVRRGGRRPRGVDPTGPQRREQRCGVREFARLRAVGTCRPPPVRGAPATAPTLQPVAVPDQRRHVAAAPLPAPSPR